MSTSGTVPPSRRPTVTDGDGTKPFKPDFYHGERNKLNHWLLQLDLYFKLASPKVPEKDRVSFAATFMRSKALSWVNTNLQKYLDDEADTEVDEWMEDFSKFKVEIRRYFGPANEAAQAETIIQNLKQTKSAADYAVTFKHFAALTNWNDDAQMSMFKRGLRDNIQDELIRYNGKIDDLDALITAVVELDDVWHQRAMTKAGGHRGGGVAGRATWGGYQGNRDTWAQRGDPMEIDVLEPQGKGTRRSGPRKCYTCGKPGHIARNYRSKNQVQRSQLNVLYELPRIRTDNLPDEEDKNSEWEVVDTPVFSPKVQFAPNPETKGSTGSSFEEAKNKEIQSHQEVWNKQRQGLADNQRRYDIDTRNYNHETMHWTACHEGYCTVHSHTKTNASREVKIPSKLGCDELEWYNCEDDRCAIHLIDKRRGGHFPGHTEE